jgi:uncharacterized protein GlcG (DUF336 family)
MHTANQRPALDCEPLELRAVPATAALALGTLTITGDADNDRIRIVGEGGSLRVLDGTDELGTFVSSAVSSIVVNAGAGNDAVFVANEVLQPVTMNGGPGRDKLVAGGGAATLSGGGADDLLIGGLGGTAFNSGGGANDLLRVQLTDSVTSNPADRILLETQPAAPAPEPTIMADEVETILQRAAAASSSSDAIIAIVDRNGRILGVRVEGGVSGAITGDPSTLVFAIDGAVAKARTGAFFGNNQAPLTSRTVQFISQSTITQREVESNPSITDPNSIFRGPGFVAPVGIGGHFPPNVQNTPQVDLFQIEHTNRDGSFHVGPDRIKGTADDILLAQRFNLNPAFVPPGQELFPPDSYGFESGIFPNAQSRGIATLPGGIPLYKNGKVVGGIGVFFPGTTGYATEENSALSTTYDPTRGDRSLEAEWIAFAAAGGTRVAIGMAPVFPVDDLNGVPLPAGFGLPTGRIDLVGITLDIFGPGGAAGIDLLAQVGAGVGRGDPDDGDNQVIVAGDPDLTRDGLPVPQGWLVMPHDGDGVTTADVIQIVSNGIDEARDTRAAIRLPLGSRAKMVFAVADRQGEIVGLFRMPDATVFSIDVAVAKARNVSYYANPTQLQPIDQVPGLPTGVAFTNRTFRFLGEPRFPEGIDGAPPGPFSQLNDGGADPFSGRQVGPRLPASAYQSVVGFDAFNPGTNFRAPTDPRNQNGIVFFPGSAPLYSATAPGVPRVLIGGFGVSGDGVDQDDVVTLGGTDGYFVPSNILRADEVFVRGIRLPYQKFNRNPEG